MKKTYLFALLLASANCRAQVSYALPLAKANSALSLPAMAAGSGVLYEAHRSFDLLRFSSRLQVSSFDLATRKELKHAVVSVPRVRGARSIDGFFLSPDGQTLVYAEVYEPNVLLVLSAKDLSEIRRTNAAPFASRDSRRLLAGFDKSGLLTFASIRGPNLRFIRMDLSNFKITSDVTGPRPHCYSCSIVWSPRSRSTWLQLPSGDWAEYTEAGQNTGAKFGPKQQWIDQGATMLEGSKLLAFFGNMLDAGSVVSYRDQHSSELYLKCVPRPYGTGAVADYAGAICTTSPDLLPERGGNKTLSSEFLLLKADGPTIVWRHRMPLLTVADSNDTDTGRQWGNPLLYRAGSKLLIVAPSKSQSLTVYEVPLPNDSSVASVSK
jgi:hypothetical protein